ncbi:MAG: phosphate signaling complex protein PhoU [Anaerolineae bacterium]
MTIPRKTLEREVKSLEDQILILGSIVEEALMTSIELLKRRDLAGAKRLIERDVEINARRYAIEGQALTLIALHQPVASDLRTLAAILEIATELERIGDYAKGIAKINVLIGEQPLLKPLMDIPLMAEKALSMLQSALTAFIMRDAEAAKTIPCLDNEVDALYNQVYAELLTYIIADPTCLDQASHLLWVAHNLERAADRVSNICERILFTVTGEFTEFDSTVSMRTFAPIA